MTVLGTDGLDRLVKNLKANLGSKLDASQVDDTGLGWDGISGDGSTDMLDMVPNWSSIEYMWTVGVQYWQSCPVTWGSAINTWYKNAKTTAGVQEAKVLANKALGLLYIYFWIEPQSDVNYYANGTGVTTPTPILSANMSGIFDGSNIAPGKPWGTSGKAVSLPIFRLMAPEVLYEGNRSGGGATTLSRDCTAYDYLRITYRTTSADGPERTAIVRSPTVGKRINLPFAFREGNQIEWDVVTKQIKTATSIDTDQVSSGTYANSYRTGRAYTANVSSANATGDVTMQAADYCYITKVEGMSDSMTTNLVSVCSVNASNQLTLAVQRYARPAYFNSLRGQLILPLTTL